LRNGIDLSIQVLNDVAKFFNSLSSTHEKFKFGVVLQTRSNS